MSFNDANSKKHYGIVTAAYWGFTLTDGALRMLVLLHFHRLGFSPIHLAFLFLLYEFCGVLTNLLGGWMGARFGLRLTLYSGLSVQVAALLLLSWMQPTWGLYVSVGYVMFTQALSGIAKDLTKMSSKSAVKLIAQNDSEGQLLKFVSLLTGSKNALKGVGFFLGGVLLDYVGFKLSLQFMAIALLIVLIICRMGLKTELGKPSASIPFRSIFSRSPTVTILSTARFFLFGSRDIWFVVALPVFLAENLQWSFVAVGTFLALWVIAYGFVQASVPKYLSKKSNTLHCVRLLRMWAYALALVPLSIGIAVTYDFHVASFVLAGLAMFGIAFAVNSTLHSYLILTYSDHEHVTLNVGFYYMANALGRLVGTLLSGLVFLPFGLSGCLYGSFLLLFASALLTTMLARHTPESYAGHLPTA